MKTLAGATALAFSLLWLFAVPALGADDSKVKAGTAQVETGAKKIGSGQIREGVEETAKGIGVKSFFHRLFTD